MGIYRIYAPAQHPTGSEADTALWCSVRLVCLSVWLAGWLEYAEQELSPMVGDCVVGHVTMYPNAQAHRSYDIDMRYGVAPSGREDAPMKLEQSWSFNGA